LVLDCICDHDFVQFARFFLFSERHAELMGCGVVDHEASASAVGINEYFIRAHADPSRLA
jgi:hypothetical protein